MEDGLGILKYCPDPTKQGQHKGNVEEFQKQWDTVGKSFVLNQGMEDVRVYVHCTHFYVFVLFIRS